MHSHQPASLIVAARAVTCTLYVINYVRNVRALRCTCVRYIYSQIRIKCYSVVCVSISSLLPLASPFSSSQNSRYNSERIYSEHIRQYSIIQLYPCKKDSLVVSFTAVLSSNSNLRVCREYVKVNLQDSLWLSKKRSLRLILCSRVTSEHSNIVLHEKKQNANI